MGLPNKELVLASGFGASAGFDAALVVEPEPKRLEVAGAGFWDEPNMEPPLEAPPKRLLVAAWPVAPKRPPGLGVSVGAAPALPKRLPALGASVAGVAAALPKRPLGLGVSAGAAPALPKRLLGLGASVAGVALALPKRVEGFGVSVGTALALPKRLLGLEASVAGVAPALLKRAEVFGVSAEAAPALLKRLDVGFWASAEGAGVLAAAPNRLLFGASVAAGAGVAAAVLASVELALLLNIVLDWPKGVEAPNRLLGWLLFSKMLLGFWPSR